MTQPPLFHGVFTALVTPFTEDGRRFDPGRLAAAVARQAAGGVRGIVPCGTTGEASTLDDEEHRAVVEHAVEAGRAHGLAVIAGTGSNDTAHAVMLHRMALGAGAHGSLQVCPYYNKPSQEGMYRHFTTVADSCDLPIMLYNIPGRTGVALTAATLERLAAHPNIQAVKDATGALATAGTVIRRTPLAVLSGDDPMTLPFMAIGAVGVVSVLSNLAPRLVVNLCDAMAAGDLAAARRHHYDALPLAEALLQLDGNPVPVKAALHLLGHDSGALRPPLAPASPETVQALRGVLSDVDLEAGARPAGQRRGGAERLTRA